MQKKYQYFSFNKNTLKQGEIMKNRLTLMLLLTGLVATCCVTASEMDERAKCKEYRSLKVCSLLANCANIGNLTVGGTDINNLVSTVNNLVTVIGGATGLPVVNSLIPFASGVLTLGVNLPLGFPTSGILLGFGSSSLAALAEPALTLTDSAFAFSVPAAGTLHDLRVSVDSVYAIGAPSTDFTFTFTILVSSCTAGTTTPYTGRGLAASATITAPAQPITVLTAGGAGCGSSATSIPVAAGDRVALLVTPSADVPTLTISTLAITAGVLYTPGA